MNKESFKIFVTNVMGITDMVLSKQCGTMLEEIADSDEDQQEKADVLAALEGLEDFTADVDYQTKIDQGYASLNNLDAEFDQAWDKHDPDAFPPMLLALPKDFPDLAKKLNGKQFQQWVEHVNNLPQPNYFEGIHRYCLSLFNSVGSGALNDAIRSAIADDDVSLLEKEAQNITAEDIRFEDINTALMIESVKVFEWLAKRAEFSDNELQEIFDYVSSDPEYFLKIYNIISPNADYQQKLRARLKDLGEVETLAVLDGVL